MPFRQHALNVIETEAAAIQRLTHCIDNHFNRACELLLNCPGKIIVMGMGKSGHIGNKMAATFASTGSPAFAINAGEASHGDFGMISKTDVLVTLSNSGKTPELVNLIPLIKRLNIPMIAITGNPDSPLAQAASVHLNIHVEREACPLNLAPTASTTSMLVLGDALAVSLLSHRGFTQEDFAFSHPGGALGKRLLLTVNDLMRCDEHIPKVGPTALMRESIMEMTSKGLGMTTVVDEQNHLLGIFTDGDLRRFFEKDYDPKTTVISEVMTQNPKTATREQLAIDALSVMESKKITSLVVTNSHNVVEGIIHIHAILDAGLL